MGAVAFALHGANGAPITYSVDRGLFDAPEEPQGLSGDALSGDSTFGEVPQAA